MQKQTLPSHIIGFRIYDRTSSYYAVKRIDNKAHWIHLGKNLDDAENKIRNYCVSKGIDLTIIRKSNEGHGHANALAGYMDLDRRLSTLEEVNAKLRARNEDLVKQIEKLVAITEKQAQQVELATQATNRIIEEINKPLAGE